MLLRLVFRKLASGCSLATNFEKTGVAKRADARVLWGVFPALFVSIFDGTLGGVFYNFAPGCSLGPIYEVGVKRKFHEQVLSKREASQEAPAVYDNRKAHNVDSRCGFVVFCSGRFGAHRGSLGGSRALRSSHPFVFFGSSSVVRVFYENRLLAAAWTRFINMGLLRGVILAAQRGSFALVKNRF